MSKKQCYRMTVAYRGTAYNGWQSQPDGRAVQDVIERAVRGLHRDPSIRVNGCSRTDLGVHALGQVASYWAEPSSFVTDEGLRDALNRKLPPDIVLRELRVNDGLFRPQKEALGKSYTYVIRTGVLGCFLSDLVTPSVDLDIEAMARALKLFEGRHDFTSFTVTSGLQPNCKRTLYEARLDRFGETICLSFTGRSFLYRMVRRLVGALIAVGTGERAPEWISMQLNGMGNPEEIKTAPPQGLYLIQVYYEAIPETFKPSELPYLMI